MKKLLTFLMVTVCLVLLGNTSNAQTPVFNDDFSTNQNTAYTTAGAIGSSAWNINRSGADFGGRRNTSPAQLELTNDVGGTANANGWVFANTSMSSFTSPYNTTLSSNVGVVTWNFNMQQIRTDPAGFASGSYGVAFILAGSSATAGTAGNGYAIALGNSGSTDPIRLVRYATGLQGTITDMITSNTSGLTDFGANYLSVRVTYTPSSNTWELFLRNDGGSAFVDPTTGTLVSQGTLVNNTHTGSSLTFMGGYWSGSTAAAQTSFFDNVSVRVTEPAPSTQATNVAFANVGDNQMDVNWTNGNGANRVVIMNTSSSFTTPTDGTNPSADASWNNAGEQVVYNGSSNTVTVTGLSAGTTYHYKVFEYSGTGSVTRFNGNTATGNPNSQATTGGGGLEPPELTAAVGATVDGAFIVTFADDVAWRNDILGIEIGGVELTAGYNVTAGQITFTPSASNPANLLQQSGSKNIVVIAASYNDNPVTQVIGPGAATHLSITTQPTAPASNGAVLAQQPIVALLDQYNNTSTSTADVVASVGAGTWSLGGTTTRAGVSGVATFTNLTASSDDAVTGATISFASTGLTGATSNTFNIPSPPTSGIQLSAVGTSYTLDFETFTGAGFQPSPGAGQLSSSIFAFTGFSDPDLAFDGTATTGDYARNSTLGGVQTSGGIYAFTSTPTGTGLGIQPTAADWSPGTMTLRAQNKTGVTATTLLVSYKVHVYNDGGNSSTFNFSHSSDNSSYTPISALNITTIEAAGPAGWTTYIKVYTVNLSLANNGLYYFRFNSDDAGSGGNRDEIVIDDFSIIVNPTSAQYPLFSGAAQDISGYGNFGLSGNLTVAGTATINAVAVLGTHNLTQTGGAATLAGTGTIDLSSSLSTQIGTYSSNTFQTTGSYIFSGTNMDIPTGTYNNFRVNGGGAQLTGDMTVGGVLFVNGTLTVGAHKLTFSGSSPNRTGGGIDATNASAEIEFTNTTTITLPSSLFTGNINRLTMTGSGLVNAANNMTVSGTLTLNNGSGFLNMGGNTLEIGTSTSNLGTLVTTNAGGTVRGTIKRWLASATVDSVKFPLDNGSGARSQVTVGFTSAPTGGSLTATFHNTNPGSLPGGFIVCPEMHLTMVNIAPQWWTVTADDGLNGGTYYLDIIGDGIAGVNEYRNIAIIKRANSGQDWAWTNDFWDVTTGSNSNPVLHLSNVTNGFSDFGVGGSNDNPLPVELASFTSSVVNNKVTLNWGTTSELNNSGFDVERKSVTGEWAKIGNVAGNGTTNEAQSYTFNDNNLTSGKYNYRLKQIDFNGNFKYYDLLSEVVVGTPAKYNVVQNYPNPFNPSTTISYELPEAKFVSLKIYDMMGREVANLVSQNQEAGFYSVKFDASKLASGMYFYKINAGDFVSVKKMMLLK